MRKYNMYLKIITGCITIFLAFFYYYKILNSSQSTEVVKAQNEFYNIIKQDIKEYLNVSSDIELPFYNDSKVITVKRESEKDFFYIKYHILMDAKLDSTFIVKDSNTTGNIYAHYKYGNNKEWEVVELIINDTLVKQYNVFQVNE